MAIKCGLKLNAPDKFHWTPDFVEVLVDVAAEGEILEAVFCGEVDGVKLIPYWPYWPLRQISLMPPLTGGRSMVCHPPEMEPVRA